MNARLMRQAAGLAVVSVLVVVGCGVPEGAESPSVASSTAPLCGVVVDPARSLFVTDATALGRFGFDRTMNQLISTGGVTTGQTSLNLFQQWWDTENTTDGGVTSTRHCDQTNPNTNGYPQGCPRAEGALASVNPFVAGNDHFTPVAIVNRFDLAPSDGAHCGEYRVVYAKDSGKTNIFNRTFIIFEAALPNPNLSAGIEGCRPVAEFWAGLSSDADATSRATKLENFYYTGLTGFSAVIRAEHYGMGTASGGYGNAPAGQIRTNQFMQFPWTLREFKLRRSCRKVLTTVQKQIIDPGDGTIIDPTPLPTPVTLCSLVMDQVTVKVNPFGPLFSTSGPPESATFQSEFVTGMGPLLATNINAISLATAANRDGTESDSQSTLNNYRVQASSNTAFRNSITTALADAGVAATVSADQLLNRATTQSCAGCHQQSNGASLGGGLPNWPSSAGFVHVDENRNISQALTTTFLPARKTVLENFVNTCIVRPPVNPNLTLSGKVVGAAN